MTVVIVDPDWLTDKEREQQRQQHLIQWRHVELPAGWAVSGLVPLSSDLAVFVCKTAPMRALFD